MPKGRKHRKGKGRSLRKIRCEVEDRTEELGEKYKTKKVFGFAVNGVPLMLMHQMLTKTVVDLFNLLSAGKLTWQYAEQQFRDIAGAHSPEIWNAFFILLSAILKTTVKKKAEIMYVKGVDPDWVLVLYTYRFKATPERHWIAF